MVPPAGVADVRDAVARAKAGEPLAAVTVVPPSAFGGWTVRRALAAGGGLVNVAWRSLGELAAGIVGLAGTGLGAGLGLGRPLPRMVRLRAVADAVGSGHRATVRAYDAAFRELRGCSPAAVAAVAAARGGADVVARFEAFRAAVQAGGWHDEVDVLLAAAEAADAAVDPVVLYQPSPFSWAEQQLVDALERAGRLTFAGEAGEGGSGAVAVPLPTPTKAIVAPDAEAEVRLAAAEIARMAAAGTSLERIALVHAGAEPYPRLVAELLDAAGVPWQGARPGTLAGTPAGRVLLGLLRLPDAGWTRSSVMAVLADAAAAPPQVLAGWEAAARAANVIGGVDGWRTRLERWAAEQRALGFTGCAERADAAHALADEVDALMGVVGPGPVVASWSASAAWALALSRWLPADERVEAAVASLGALDGVIAPPTMASFADAVAAQLELEPAVPPAAAGRGVLVGALDAVAGADVDAVIVLGVNEGRLPSRHPDDPLLPDRLRAHAGGELPTRRDRRAREQLLLARLLAGARERVLCAPRADQRAQHEQLPSRWLAAAGSHNAVPSFAAAVLTRPAASAQEAALQALAGGASPSAFGIERGMAAVAARASSAVTEWDGSVGRHPTLVMRGRRSTAAAFERWASCPFSYFLRSVLRVQETVRPEERAGVDAQARGALVHAVLHALDLARMAGETVSLESAAAGVASALEESGRVRPGLAWDLERRTLAATLATVTELDRAEREASGFVTVDADVSFDDAPIGRTGVRFAGHADRVDVDGAGTRRVLDYRTGRSDRGRPPADVTAAGTRLQLPVAAIALGASVAEQWYVNDAAKGHPRVRTDVDGAVAARVADVVDHVAGAIEVGAFAAHPGDAVLDSWTNCRRCPYDRVCPSERGDAAERKQHDPVAVHWRGLQLQEGERP